MKPSGGLGTEYAPPLDLPFRFLATALAWMAVLVVAYPWHVPLLTGSFYNPHLTTFVHVNTLGVIAPTIMGASYQLLPVVLGIPIASVPLARLSWWLYLPALPLFLLGLSQAWLVPLALGGSLLAGALATYAGIVIATLLRVRHRDLVFWHLAVAVPGLLGGATLGLLLAFSKQPGFLGDLTLRVLGAHAVLMLAGWVTVLLMGVAYRLVGMFTLTEDLIRADWGWATLLLTAAGAWLLPAALLFSLGQSVALIGAIVLLAGVLGFIAQIGRLHALRRRRTYDVHIPFLRAALGLGLLAVGAVVFGLAAGREAGDPVWVAAGWLAVAGWAQTAIQGFLYKIGTFLTWLHRYAPLAGLQAVPRLDDLYGRGTARLGFACWVAGVLLGARAALAQVEAIALLAAALLSIGLGAFLLNAGRVGSHWRVRPVPTLTSSAIPSP